MSDHRLVVSVSNDNGIPAKQLKKRIIDALTNTGEVSVVEQSRLGRPKSTDPVGPPVTVRLPPDDDAGLIRIMQKEGSNKAAVIRRAVRELLDREVNCTNKQTEKGEIIPEKG